MRTFVITESLEIGMGRIEKPIAVTQEVDPTKAACKLDKDNKGIKIERCDEKGKWNIRGHKNSELPHSTIYKLYELPMLE